MEWAYLKILEKPDWLKEKFKEWNWEIGGVGLFIGDWIEFAIDWVLFPLNYTLSWGIAVYNYVVDLRQEVLDWFDLLTRSIADIWGYFTIEVAAWWSNLAAWWEGKRIDVLGWIDVAIQDLREIPSKLEEFFTVTLPTLITDTDLELWWRGEAFSFDKLIKDTLAIWFPFYNELAELWGEIGSFFTDPLQWLYDKAEEFFERFW